MPEVIIHDDTSREGALRRFRRKRKPSAARRKGRRPRLA